MSAAAAQPFATSDNITLDQNTEPYVKALKAAATSDGAFLHYPRPPGIPGAAPRHRDYLNHGSGHPTPSNYLNSACDQSSGEQTFITLHRSLTTPTASFDLHVENGYLNIKLSPAALRELARMCIDAAHDIEANP
jgi:hypothetical protein